MDVQSLPELLDELLNEAGGEGIEVCLSHAATVPPPERDAVREEYEQRYARVLRSMDGAHGKPAFMGTPSDRDYPAWHHARCLSYWQSTTGFVYVALCDDAKTLRLVAGVRPYPFEPETITLLPPAD